MSPTQILPPLQSTDTPPSSVSVPECTLKQDSQLPKLKSLPNKSDKQLVSSQLVNWSELSSHLLLVALSSLIMLLLVSHNYFLMFLWIRSRMLLLELLELSLTHLLLS